MMANPLWNVPNLLSLSRVPLAAWLCVAITYQWWLVSLGTFIIAALTDWLDGWWARHFNQLSPLGRSLDPLTDKVLIGAALIFLIPVPGLGVEPWIVAVILVREILITGLRGMVEATGQHFSADWFGKLKTVLQCVVLIALFVLQAARTYQLQNEIVEPLAWLSWLLLYFTVFATLGSALQYCYKALKILSAQTSPV